VRRRYTAIARFYDVLSFERPVYGAGRRRMVADLGLRTGDLVLDLGCGTGLNFEPVQARIGPAGQIVGIDASADMLRQARRRADRQHWRNITLVQADATTVSTARLRGELDALPPVEPAAPSAARPVDAVIATYSLSLMPQWRRAWRTALAVTAAGSRLGIADMQRPVGRYRWLTWLAKLACALGGSCMDTRAWTALAGYPDQRTRLLCGGHIVVRTATVGPGDNAPVR